MSAEEQRMLAELKSQTEAHERLCRLMGFCPECANDLYAAFEPDRPAVYRCNFCDWEERIVYGEK